MAAVAAAMTALVRAASCRPLVNASRALSSSSVASGSGSSSLVATAPPRVS